MSMARLTLPSRLELNSFEGSFRDAPLKNVSLTIDLYDSPVQMPPSCDQTGVPIHFHSSRTSGSASLMRARSLATVSPLQSPNSAIFALISLEAAGPIAFNSLFILSVSGGRDSAGDDAGRVSSMRSAGYEPGGAQLNSGRWREMNRSTRLTMPVTLASSLIAPSAPRAVWKGCPFPIASYVSYPIAVI